MGNSQRPPEVGSWRRAYEDAADSCWTSLRQGVVPEDLLSTRSVPSQSLVGRSPTTTMIPTNGTPSKRHRRVPSKAGSTNSQQQFLVGVMLCTLIIVMVQVHVMSRCVTPQHEGIRRKVDVDAQNAPTKLQTVATPIIDNACHSDYEREISGRTPGLTEDDLERSKAYRGNRRRLATLAQKLADGTQAVHGVVCGGSISVGHGVHTPYARRLEQWLDETFPLSSNNKSNSGNGNSGGNRDHGPGGHRIINMGTHGSDICAMAKRTNRLIEEVGPDVDLWILEFAVNDYQGQDHIEMVVDQTDLFFDGFLDVAACTEAVLVKLLTAYPDAAVVFVEMRTAVATRKSGAVLHLGAAQHYQVPVISYEDVVWPDYLVLLDALKDYNYTTLINDTVLPYPHGCHECDREGMIDDLTREEGCQSVCVFAGWSEFLEDCDAPQSVPPGRKPCFVPWLAHDEVHPSGIGHEMVKDLLVEAIASTKRDLCRQRQAVSSEEDAHAVQQLPPILARDAKLPRYGWMAPNPLLLQAQTNFVLVKDTYTMFTEMDELKPSAKTDGFLYLEDRFDRWGWIATNEEGNESITFELDLPVYRDPALEETPDTAGKEDNLLCYIPYLSVLHSYENMGRMTVTVKDRKNGREVTEPVDSLWDPRISVPRDVQLLAAGDLRAEGSEGCSGDTAITVTSLPKVEGRGGNKIKILTLSARPCVPRELREE